MLSSIGAAWWVTAAEVPPGTLDLEDQAYEAGIPAVCVDSSKVCERDLRQIGKV